MSEAGRESQKYVLGGALILAMIIGGGTRSGLLTDSMISVVVLLASIFVLARNKAISISTPIFTLLIVVVLALLLQLVPFPRALIAELRLPPIDQAISSSDSPISTISLGVGHTIHSLVVFVALAMFACAVTSLRSKQIIGLVPFFFTGVVCNLVAGAIQFSISDQVVIDNLLSYNMTAGFFANINHFSALLFVTIPLLLYFSIIRGRMIAGAVGLIFVLLMLLSAGSRAGVVIGLLIFVASLLLLTAKSRAGIGALVAVFVGVALYTIGVWARFESENTAGLDDLRLEFLQTSWEGIKQNWLLGIGYGNFEKAYQIYEKPEQIFQYFVNHAHNEYVQLVFEGGILAAGLIMSYLIVIHVQIWRNGTDGFRKVAYLSILFLLLHSLIDYPLRTYALAMAFAFFNAVLFYTGTFLPKARTEPVEIVESE